MNNKQGKQNIKPNPEASMIAEQIKQFDEWFRYAENIGQQRLYNFLMVSSIMLAGCATLLVSSSFHGHILAIVLSLFGILMSLAWAALGSRQAKFHNMLDWNIERLCRDYDEVGGNMWNLPIKHVHRMKQEENTQLPYIEIFYNNISLNWFERKSSNRLFLFVVPFAFAGAFSAVLVVSGMECIGNDLNKKPTPVVIGGICIG